MPEIEKQMEVEDRMDKREAEREEAIDIIFKDKFFYSNNRFHAESLLKKLEKLGYRRVNLTLLTDEEIQVAIKRIYRHEPKNTKTFRRVIAQAQLDKAKGVKDGILDS